MAYEFVDEPIQEEGLLAGIGRQGARQASNLATRAIGLPGDIFSLVNEFIANPATKALTGENGLPYEETFLGKAIPTTQTHRKGIEAHTGEYLKPQNEVERFADDVIEDAALMLVPGGNISKASTIPKKLAISLGANVAGQAIKDAGGTENASTFGKLGTLFTLSLFDKKGAAKHLSDLYKQAEVNLPENASINANRLLNNLDSLERKITKGRPSANVSPSEKFVLDEIDKITDTIKDGKANIQQLWAQKRSLNEQLAKQLFETPTKEAQGRAKKLAKQLNHWLSQEIGSYAEKNRAFGKPFKKAEEGFGTIAKSNLMSRFIEKNLKYTPLTSGLLHMFGSEIGATVAKSFLPYQATKLVYRIAKSPTLAKHYAKTVSAAASENIAVFNKEFKNLDEAIQEEESKDRYEFVN